LLILRAVHHILSHLNHHTPQQILSWIPAPQQILSKFNN
jgi:hypothetical protein